MDTVEVGTYLNDICDNLEAGLLPDTRISLVREIDDFAIHVDHAIPIGLIVNEAVTNAVKYGFATGAEGRIVVRFRVRGGRATLIVADDGRGFSPGRTLGIGTRMMRALADQIDAQLRIMGRRGVVCALAFATGQPPP